MLQMRITKRHKNSINCKKNIKSCLTIHYNIFLLLHSLLNLKKQETKVLANVTSVFIWQFHLIFHISIIFSIFLTFQHTKNKSKIKICLTSVHNILYCIASHWNNVNVKAHNFAIFVKWTSSNDLSAWKIN